MGYPGPAAGAGGDGVGLGAGHGAPAELGRGVEGIDPGRAGAHGPRGRGADQVRGRERRPAAADARLHEEGVLDPVGEVGDRVGGPEAVVGEGPEGAAGQALGNRVGLGAGHGVPGDEDLAVARGLGGDVRRSGRVADIISVVIVNINVTAYAGNAAVERILPAIKLGRILRAQAQRSVVALPVPVLSGPDAPTAIAKARIGQDVFEPAGARVDTRSVASSRDRAAKCFCNRRVICVLDAVIFEVKIYRQRRVMAL